MRLKSDNAGSKQPIFALKNILIAIGNEGKAKSLGNHPDSVAGVAKTSGSTGSTPEFLANPATKILHALSDR